MWDVVAYTEITEFPYNLEDMEGKLLSQKWLPSVGPVFYLMSFKNFCVARKSDFCWDEILRLRRHWK